VRWLGRQIKQSNEYANKILISKESYEFATFDLTVTLDDRDFFYGFELDGNQKYLLSDLTVTYNSNGKSTTVDLAKYAFGDYYDVLAITVLTRKRGGSSNATPELADKAGKRLLVLQEPEHDDVINVGYMKELTGGDWITARPLFGVPFTYKPQFKLLLTCNKLPNIPSNDGGTWRRLRVTPWESEFVEGTPETSNQFVKDHKLGKKLKEWKQAFMWILLTKYYPEYRKNGLKEPKKVSTFTNKYKKESDIYWDFITENLTITKKKKDYESFADIFCSFRGWYKDYYNGNSPTKNELRNYLESLGLTYENNNVYGIKFFGGGEDIDLVSK